MPDTPDRTHPADISRRAVLRGVLCTAFGSGPVAHRGLPMPATAPATDEEPFVPENNYPTFADEPTGDAISASRPRHA